VVGRATGTSGLCGWTWVVTKSTVQPSSLVSSGAACGGRSAGAISRAEQSEKLEIKHEVGPGRQNLARAGSQS
jgi:hypothetical protein